jgi:general secretion pathway protein A
MYLSFFGLNEKPFAITPDPRYLFLSARHAEALAHLVYGIKEAGGFIQLTGEVGTGKTTIIRSLLAQIPRDAEVALILNPRLSPTEFMLTICEELGIGVPDESVHSAKDLVDILNAYLLRAHSRGQRVVLVVDEAHNLDREVLEQVRLLTNLETATQKLLQIILIGQPELRELLDRNDLRQVAQRITGRYHLSPLSREETAAYVRHRLGVAGSTREIFSPLALIELYRLSGGVPRLINILSDRAMLGAYAQDRHSLTGALVREGAHEVFGRRYAPIWWPYAATAMAALVLALGLAVLWQSRSAPATPATATTATTVPAAPAAAAPIAPTTLAATPEPATSLERLLSGFAGETDPDNAFNKLFALWNARYVVGRRDACTQATEQRLECLIERGTLADLRLYNRPAVLTLTAPDGRIHQVVLAALDDERAIVSLGGAPREVRVGELARLWFGEFVLLWRPDVPQARPLSIGMRGKDVQQLRSDLARLRGAAAAAAPGNVYDDELRKWVEDFQRTHRLNVDGVAGIPTLVVLDTVLAAAGTPLLDARPATAKGG